LFFIKSCFIQLIFSIPDGTARIHTPRHNKNLGYFQTTKVLSRKQARWAEILSAYDFKIEHLDGTKNPAGGPSRCPDYQRGYERPSARLLATTSTSYQYLFANAVEIEPIDKDVFAEIIECNVRGRGSLSHYLVYSESPPWWCSLAIISPIYLHHKLLLVSNRSIQNTYRLVILAVLTLLSLSCSLERFAFVYHVNISKTRYTITPDFYSRCRESPLWSRVDQLHAADRDKAVPENYSTIESLVLVKPTKARVNSEITRGDMQDTKLATHLFQERGVHPCRFET
jgi:hypothetical protein